MSKKLIALTLALILVLSLSALAFADTTPTVDNTTADIPVSIRQEFIDDAPEGHYLANLVRVDIDDEFYKIEATYLPLVQVAATEVSGAKYVNYYYSGLGVNILRYQLNGTFLVNYDGSVPQCTGLGYQKTYQYDNAPNGYTFDVVSEYRTLGAGYGSLTVTFDVYWAGTPTNQASDTGSIACDEYGNIY